MAKAAGPRGRRKGHRRALFFCALLLGFFSSFARPSEGRPFVLATWDLDGLAAAPPAPSPLEESEKGEEREAGPLRHVEETGKDLAALGRYAERLAPDIIALEGIASAEAARVLFPPERYTLVLADIPPPFALGFAVRRPLTLTRHPDLAALDVYGAGAPRHLRAGADVTVSGPGLPPLRLLAVHLKAGCRRGLAAEDQRPACRVLSAQLEVIARWIAEREEGGEAFAVLGDFNVAAGRADGLLPALGAGGRLREATAGFASPCWGGEPFVDRIVLGGAAQAWLVPQSLHVLVYRETERAARVRLSAHCPVAVTLDPGLPGGEEAR